MNIKEFSKALHFTTALTTAATFSLIADQMPVLFCGEHRVGEPQDSLSGTFHSPDESMYHSGSWLIGRNKWLTTDENGRTIVTYTTQSAQGNLAHFDKSGNRTGDHLGVKDYRPLTQEENAALKAALAIFEESVNITFVEMLSGSEANIVFRFGDMSEVKSETGKGVAAHATFPDNTYGANVTFDNDEISSYEPGGFGFLAKLHEIGHVLGLKHPHTSFGDTGAAILDKDEDSVNVTVMSYEGSHTGKIGGKIAGRGRDSSPHTLMSLDINELQFMYGENADHNPRNDTYKLTGERKVHTIWDGGGLDGLDSTNYSGPVIINLNDLRSDVSCVGNTFTWSASGAEIENATSGAGDDLVIGTHSNNTIVTNRGNDVIIDGPGDDILTGGEGRDTFVRHDTRDWFTIDTDTITDFNPKEDAIFLGENIVSVRLSKGTVDSVLTFHDIDGITVSSLTLSNLVIDSLDEIKMLDSKRKLLKASGQNFYNINSFKSETWLEKTAPIEIPNRTR